VRISLRRGHKARNRSFLRSLLCPLIIYGREHFILTSL
jgi:hypothetical protein